MPGYHDLAPAIKADYLETLQSSHRIRTTVEVRNQDGTLHGDLTGYVVGGQVDLEWQDRAGYGEERDPNIIGRQLQVTLEDSNMKVSFTPEGSLYADKQLRATYGVLVPGYGWVDDDVFRGPVSRWSRDGSQVTVEALSKEALMMPPVKHKSLGQPDNRKVSTYIRNAGAAYGETMFDLAAGEGLRVPKSFNIGPGKANEKGAWWYLRELAASVNLRLIYDGRGYLTLRKPQTDSLAYTFKDVLSEPVVGFDLGEFRNQVEVYDTDGKGHAVLKGLRFLAASHPLSAQSLARNGVPLVLVEKITPGVKSLTVARADAIANRTLKQRAREAVEVQFDALPVPFLDPGDALGLETSTINIEFVLHRATLPLGPEAMAVGYSRPRHVAAYASKKNAAAVRRAIRRHRRHK